jgi:hypothetical protein
LLGAARRVDEDRRRETAEQRDRGERAAGLLRQDRHLDRPQAAAAVLLGDRDPRPAQLDQPRPEVLVADPALGTLAHTGRAPVVVEDAPRGLLDRQLFFAQTEVHDRP